VPRTKRDIEKQKIFARSLKALVELHHIKDAATLARLAGMDSSSISRYLRAKAIPNSGGMLALAKVFGVTAEELMAGATAPVAQPINSEERFMEINRRLNNLAEAIIVVYSAVQALAASGGDAGDAGVLRKVNKRLSQLGLGMGKGRESSNN